MADTKNTGNTIHVIKPLPKIPRINGAPEQSTNSNNNNDNNDNITISSSAQNTEENGAPVNMATGEYIYEDKDFIIPDMGGNYNLIKRYTGPAGQKNSSSLGKVWALSTDTNVREEGNYAIVTMQNGKTAEYTKYNGTYENKKGGTEKAGGM